VVSTSPRIEPVEKRGGLTAAGPTPSAARVFPSDPNRARGPRPSRSADEAPLRLDIGGDRTDRPINARMNA
jgi:hypothetical protein